jgi:hypothetical protein
MSTVQEIEGAITKLSTSEWLELRQWFSEREQTEGVTGPEATVDWTQSACVLAVRDPAKQIPAEMVIDVLDELRR